MNDDEEEERPRARLRAVERFRFGDDTVTDTSFNNTTFGPPRPAPRVIMPRRGRRAPVRGYARHIARRRLARKVKKTFPGMYRDDVAKSDVRAKRARRAAAPMQEIPEEEDSDDDTEVAVLPPDEHDAWGSHGGDEPGSGSPPGITA